MIVITMPQDAPVRSIAATMRCEETSTSGSTIFSGHDKNLKCATITVVFTKPMDNWGKACDNMKTIGKHRMLWVIKAQEHSKMYENGTFRKPW